MEENKVFEPVESIIKDIKANLTQRSVNKIDENKVMRAMLNDPNFSISVYDKSAGYVGQRCPRKEAVKFLKNVISGATGLDRKDSEHLAENYEFTKGDANFMLTNMRDFLQTYTDTGRKINIIQSEKTEASIFTKPIGATNKKVPDKDNPGESKDVTTAPYIKLVSSSKCPKYNM